ncbi:hypothetical protein DL767_009372 [Monosporascus sp. MG133]|nr:hypothetical protein DL767_009372 [Monosporascus sp. MG133]
MLSDYSNLGSNRSPSFWEESTTPRARFNPPYWKKKFLPSSASLSSHNTHNNNSNNDNNNNKNKNQQLQQAATNLPPFVDDVRRHPFVVWMSDELQMINRPERQTSGRPSRARPEGSSARRQGRWEPQEEPRRYRLVPELPNAGNRKLTFAYRGSSVRSATVGWHEGHEASGHRYQGDDYERRGHRYQGDDYERRGHRYQGDDYERRGHRYQGDDYERGGYRYRDDDYERPGRRYEDDRDGHMIETCVNPVPQRDSRRRPSPPRYRDPYEDDYAWRERSPPRRRSPSRYRGRGYGRRSPIPPRSPSLVRPRSPSLVRPRALPPVSSRTPSLARPRAPSLARPRAPSMIRPRAPPPAPAPPRAPQPRVSGNRVWLTPKPKPPHVPPLPLDRNLIHCENCNRQHDPRLCRGPVINGRINVCARCGSKRHMFEECWFGDPAVDDLDYFLWHPRQGLAPISTRIDLSDRQAVPGHHVRPVYSRKFAQEQYTREKTEKMRLRLPYLERTIDYGSLQVPEFECMNTPLDPSLVGYTRGPPPSRNPRRGHAGANVETDVDAGMPIPAGVEMDVDGGMSIPADVETDVDGGVPIPADVETDVDGGMSIPTDADLDVDEGMPMPAGGAGGNMPSEAPAGCIISEEFS